MLPFVRHLTCLSLSFLTSQIKIIPNTYGCIKVRWEDRCEQVYHRSWYVHCRYLINVSFLFPLPYLCLKTKTVSSSTRCLAFILGIKKNPIKYLSFSDCWVDCLILKSLKGTQWFIYSSLPTTIILSFLKKYPAFYWKGPWKHISFCLGVNTETSAPNTKDGHFVTVIGYMSCWGRWNSRRSYWTI